MKFPLQFVETIVGKNPARNNKKSKDQPSTHRTEEYIVCHRNSQSKIDHSYVTGKVFVASI